MAKKPQNSGKIWENSEIKNLKKLADQNTPTRLIAYELDRAKAAIYNKAQELGISLHPTNKSPYNRRKK